MPEIKVGKRAKSSGRNCAGLEGVRQLVADHALPAIELPILSAGLTVTF